MDKSFDEVGKLPKDNGDTYIKTKSQLFARRELYILEGKHEEGEEEIENENKISDDKITNNYIMLLASSYSENLGKMAHRINLGSK